jgi:hypothetical protein
MTEGTLCSGTEDLRVYLFNKVLESGADYSIVNGTKGTDDFYSGGTVTLLNTKVVLMKFYFLQYLDR